MRYIQMIGGFHISDVVGFVLYDDLGCITLKHDTLGELHQLITVAIILTALDHLVDDQSVHVDDVV